DATAQGCHLVDGERPVAVVEDAAHQRLVERGMGGAEATDPDALAQSARHGATQRQTAVLDQVVGIDVDVAVAVQAHVHPAVLGEGLQHVAEEGQRHDDVGGAAAVDVDADADARLARFAVELADPPGGAAVTAHGTAPSPPAISTVAAPASPVRARIEAVCPCNPSASARRQAAGARRASSAGESRVTLDQRTKSITESGPAYRAAPPVGRV